MPSRSHRRGAAVRAALLVAFAVVALVLIVNPTGTGATSRTTLSWARTGVAASTSLEGRLSLLTPPVFGANYKANQDNTTYGQHEPSLAVSRVHTNTVVVASKDYRDANVKHVWIDGSTDGGLTWPVQLHMPGVPTALNIQSDPVVMARDDGRIYVSCLGTNSSQSAGGIFITWTDDDGATWHDPSVQVYYPENTLDDKDWFAIDNSPSSPYYHHMYMMYAPGAGYVVEQHSSDGGLTWSTRQTIGQSGTEYTYPVVGSDGTVYNFMMDNWGALQTGTILLTKSTDGGATWTTPTTVAQAQQPNSPIRQTDQFRFFAIMSAAVDPNNGDLYIAWTDNRNFATDGTDVVYVKSTDGGSTWSAVTRLSHDPTGVVRDHITPMLTVGADSKLHAFWLDRRLDANNHLFDSWYSSSTDGGTTWDPDTRVSTVSQDMDIAFPPGSGNAAGDYWGLDTAQDAVYVAWNDTRSGNQDIWVAKGLMGGGGSGTPTATPVVTQTPTSTPTHTVIPSGTATSTLTPTAVTTGTPSTTVTPCAITFTDVLPSDYFYEAVTYLYCHGVISGYADNTFRPYNNTTRGQMAKIVVLGFGIPIWTPSPSATPTFNDVPPDNAFYQYVETAAHNNIVSGYADGTYRPNTNVTRGQLSKIIVVGATIVDGWPLLNPPTPTFSDVPANSPFYTYIETAYCHQIISGYADGTFHPFADATRGQISKIQYLAILNTATCAVTPTAGPSR